MPCNARLRNFRFLSLLLCGLLSSCSSVNVPQRFHNPAPLAGDPVVVVPLPHPPELKLDTELRSKQGGFLAGAGQGALWCGEAMKSNSGEAAVLALLFCLPIMSLAGGIQGILTTGEGKSAADLDHNENLTQSGKSAQSSLTAQVRSHLSRLDATPNHRDAPQLPEQVGRADALLEIGVTEFAFTREGGKKDRPVCLQLTAEARLLDDPAGQPRDRLLLKRQVGCLQPDAWLADNGANLLTALAEAYQHLAEEIVDDFFLVYYPPADPFPPELERQVPSYVLSPISPAPPRVAFDLNPAKWNDRLTYIGGIHFRQLDTLTPKLSWERFPRPFDFNSSSAQVEDIRYDLRLLHFGPRHGSVGPRPRVLEVNGLSVPEFQLKEPLSPCSRYFWSVRARFTLNGRPRATEWGGVYKNLGGHYPPYAHRRQPGHMTFPPDQLYYPMATPADTAGAACGER